MATKKPAFIRLDGETYLPSLLTHTPDTTLKIKSNLGSNSDEVEKRIKHLPVYETEADYGRNFIRCSQVARAVLKFVAMFRSVQKLQIERQAMLFPDVFTTTNSRKIEDGINQLLAKDFIHPRQYYHEYKEKWLPFYTLTQNGYYAMKYFEQVEMNYYPPRRFKEDPPSQHERFWQLVDLYQAVRGNDNFKGFTHFFNGFKSTKIPISFCVLALEVSPSNVLNFIVYPVVDSDFPVYLEKKLLYWSNLIDLGNSERRIEKLGGKINVFTIYVNTKEKARYLIENLRLEQYDFHIIFIIGEELSTKGISNAFYDIEIEETEKGGTLHFIDAINL